LTDLSASTVPSGTCHIRADRRRQPCSHDSRGSAIGNM